MIENTIFERPVELLQNLIRFDTTNPPGNEGQCIEYINHLLTEAGIETTILSKSPARPNLVARLKGTGNAPPLLMYGHVDVITTVNQDWSHPPFEALIHGDYLWGRGSLDMKHGIAMYLAALLKAKSENIDLPGDVIFAAMADEEAFSQFGARFLVEEHPDLFKDVVFALSEFGGFTLTFSGKRFYPIQVAEKQLCPTRVTFTGKGGHGANPIHQGAMAKLGSALKTLDRGSLPVHITPPVKAMLAGFARELGGLQGFVINQLSNPGINKLMIALLKKRLPMFIPLLMNTASPTMLQGSDKINVIPSRVSLDLDCRLLPGFKGHKFKEEMMSLLGSECSIETHSEQLDPPKTNMGLFETLANSLRSLDDQGILLPYVNPAVTDARFLSKLGIQTYGFTPLRLPADFAFLNTVHAADERVPVEAIEFGLKAVYTVLQTFHG